MKMLYLLLFLKLLGIITCLTNIKAYNCFNKNVKKVGTYDITKVAECEVYKKWHNKSRKVKAQVIYYPEYGRLQATVCTVMKTVKITQCGSLDGVR